MMRLTLLGFVQHLIDSGLCFVMSFAGWSSSPYLTLRHCNGTKSGEDDPVIKTITTKVSNFFSSLKFMVIIDALFIYLFSIHLFTMIFF